MNSKIKIWASVLLLSLSLTAVAQNGSNSSYSRFGLGTLADQSQTFNRGMGGVAYALRDGSRVNMLNPASYSCIDSLSFLFDVGMSLQYGHLSAPGSSVNVRNTTLTNVNAGFRLAKNLGMSFGFVPYSTIGYTFTSEGKVGSSYTSSQSIKSTTKFTGSGGMQEIYLGVGWKPFADLSIGANIGYLWGSNDHAVTQSFSEGSTASSNYNSQYQQYAADLYTYKLDAGIQYPINITKQDRVTLAATFSLGHNLSGDANLLRYTSSGDSTEYVAKNAFSLPHTYGGGISWQHKGNLIVAADYTQERWADCKLPVSNTNANGEITYTSQTGNYTNRTKIAGGVEFIPNPASRNYFEMIRYRAGFSYATPYTKINGLEGPKEYRATIGFGFPLSTRKLGGRSAINVSAEWLMRNPSEKSMIKENYLILNLGITFNERWFMKWKIE